MHDFEGDSHICGPDSARKSMSYKEAATTPGFVEIVVCILHVAETKSGSLEAV